MITSLQSIIHYHVLLNPKTTFRTLFELSSFYEIDEFFVVFAEGVANFEFLTCHVFMPFYSTLQTIVSFANWTLKPCAIFWCIEKTMAAVSCRTPWSILNGHVTLYHHWCRHSFWMWVTGIVDRVFHQRCDGYQSLRLPNRILSLDILVETSFQLSKLNNVLRSSWTTLSCIRCEKYADIFPVATNRPRTNSQNIFDSSLLHYWTFDCADKVPLPQLDTSWRISMIPVPVIVFSLLQPIYLVLVIQKFVRIENDGSLWHRCINIFDFFWYRTHRIKRSLLFLLH
jgi:hypothetical protein